MKNHPDSLPRHTKMSAQSEHISVPRTARFGVRGQKGTDISTVILVLHGYGMSALACLESFSYLEQQDVLLVAPEGLSRFYRKGFDGDVVASWMAREDRLYEIEDQITYLDKLLDLILSDHAPSAENVVVIGYSQGVATGSRWVTRRKGQGISRFVVYAGTMAADTLTGDWPVGVPVLQVCSDTDEFISSSDFHEQLSKLQAFGIQVSQIKYEGKHAVEPDAVLSIKTYLSGK